MLARHRADHERPDGLTLAVVRALIDGQARADRDAGVDWAAPADPDRVTRAHTRAYTD